MSSFSENMTLKEIKPVTITTQYTFRLVKQEYPQLISYASKYKPSSTKAYKRVLKKPSDY